MALPDYVQRRRDTFDVLGLLTDSEGQTITAAGNSTTPLQVGVGAEFEVVVDVDTISGTTPTLDVTIEGSDTGAFGGEEVAVDVVPQIDDSADPGQKRIAFKSEHEYIRASWATGGTTPSFATTISLRN
jgi:hypothetical protein